MKKLSFLLSLPLILLVHTPLPADAGSYDCKIIWQDGSSTTLRNGRALPTRDMTYECNWGTLSSYQPSR